MYNLLYYRLPNIFVKSNTIYNFKLSKNSAVLKYLVKLMNNKKIYMIQKHKIIDKYKFDINCNFLLRVYRIY